MRLSLSADDGKLRHIKTHMSVEDFNDLLRAGAIADLGTGDTFANIPIASEEGGWAAIQRIPEHGTLLNWPPRQNGEAAAKCAAVVELAIGQDEACLAPDAAVVLLRPAFLQCDDMWLRIRDGELSSDLAEPLPPQLGDVLEAPAVERDYRDLGRNILHFVESYQSRRAWCTR